MRPSEIDSVPSSFHRELIFGGLVILLLVGGLTGIGPSTIAKWFSGPPPVPDCYSFGNKPLRSKQVVFSPSATPWFVNGVSRGRARKALAMLQDATNYCRLDNCPSAARNAYSRAVNRYVRERAWTHQKYFLEYGEPGLQWIQDQYATIPHDRVVEGLKQRYAAGLYETDRARHRTATELLIHRPARDFGPCRID